MVIEPKNRETEPPEQRSNGNFILSTIDRLAADIRSNMESIRADVRQLYLLNILTLLTALGALITGLFTLLTR